MPQTREIVVEINGKEYRREVEPRLLLSDFIRHEAGLTGTHVGCEHGVCGACTVQMDGVPVRSCLMFAVQAQGHSLRTVEAMNEGMGGELHPLQQAFHECHGLQCGFCTPGFLMSIEPFLAEAADWDERQIREALAGNLCRCTGYQNIVSSVQLAAERMRAGELPASGEQTVRVAGRRLMDIIRNVRLRGREGTADVAIEGELIVAVEPSIEASGEREYDGEGNLLLPGLINAHQHLDKTMLGEAMRPNRSQTLQEAIYITWDHKRSYTIEEIAARAVPVVEAAIRNGTTAMRAFADVDTIGGLVPVRGPA